MGVGRGAERNGIGIGMRKCNFCVVWLCEFCWAGERENGGHFFVAAAFHKLLDVRCFVVKGVSHSYKALQLGVVSHCLCV